MNFDELKECTRCGSDACYRQEISKDISIELCYGCGFQSNSLMKKGSEFFNQQWELLPELYKVLSNQLDLLHYLLLDHSILCSLSYSVYHLFVQVYPLLRIAC